MVCVGGAGAVPYYTMWPTLDYRGLNDEVIAHTPVERRGLIGHEHHASRNYMLERGVVVFDVMNRLVIDDDPMRFQGKTRVKDGEEWRLHAVQLGSKAMVFASPQPLDVIRQQLPNALLLY